MFHRTWHLLTTLLLALWLVSATFANPAAAQDDKLQVVTTFSILQDVVANVGGDAIALETIVPAGGDAHTFDPSPDQVASISDADLIFEIGLDFEPWLPDMVDAAGTDAQQVAVTDGLELITAEEHAHEGEEAHADEEEHEHGATDPHVWHDVSNVIAITATVRDALIAADPANAATYEANAAAYTTELQTLDQWVRDQVAALPEERRKLVTSHDTFAYFARAYDFEVIGTAIASVSTESGDPSAEEIAALVEQIEATGVPAIFTENVSNPDIVDAVASEAGVTVGPALYTDALGEPGSEGDTYIKLVTWNVTSIVIALGA